MNFSGSILLVDDEAHIRKFISLLLRHLGMRNIFEAKNGVEALEVFQRERPDLVMLDVNMPVLDGIQTLRELKRIDPDCVVIMLTSLVNRQTIDEASAYGAANYIRKDAPFEEIGRTLSETIEEFVEPRRSDKGGGAG
ncbi:MAG TPA: response regulator transcription factor [Opitutaceae bacterium]